MTAFTSVSTYINYEQETAKLATNYDVDAELRFDLVSNIDYKQIITIAKELLKAVGLQPDNISKYPSELSGGMQKRVALARAIATKPEIIFFDEPTTGLDPIMTDIISELIIKCVKAIGASAITITHDIGSAVKIADRIGLMYKGNIIWVGTGDELKKSDNPYVKQFLNGKSEGPIKVI